MHLVEEVMNGEEVSPNRIYNKEFKAKWLKETDYKWPFKIEEISKVL